MLSAGESFISKQDRQIIFLGSLFNIIKADKIALVLVVKIQGE